MNIGFSLLLGAFGAFAPDIARWHKKRGKRKREVYSYWDWVVTILYVLTGGVMAAALQAANPIAAIYIGATWDVSLSAVLHRRGPFELQAAKAYVTKVSPIRAFWDSLRDHADELF
jgi:hypothetical protein